MISEEEYVRRAQRELAALISALDEAETDNLECELESDILTLEFSDGAKYVINSHRAARQIWMAAERKAWHFDFHPERGEWLSDKGGDELWAALNAALATKLPKEFESAGLPRPTALQD